MELPGLKVFLRCGLDMSIYQIDEKHSLLPRESADRPPHHLCPQSWRQNARIGVEGRSVPLYYTTSQKTPHRHQACGWPAHELCWSNAGWLFLLGVLVWPTAYSDIWLWLSGHLWTAAREVARLSLHHRNPCCPYSRFEWAWGCWSLVSLQGWTKLMFAAPIPLYCCSSSLSWFASYSRGCESLASSFIDAVLSDSSTVSVSVSKRPMVCAQAEKRVLHVGYSSASPLNVIQLKLLFDVSIMKFILWIFYQNFWFSFYTRGISKILYLKTFIKLEDQ